MKFITFSDEERINIALIDNQHQAIAKLINTVHGAYTGKKQKLLKTSITALHDLLRIHFDDEERLMLETKFIGYYSHKLEHDRFYKKVGEFISGRLTLNADEIDNMKKWFYNHIEISDKKCGEHFVNEGLK